MKTLSINGSKRAGTGKKDAKALRNAGMVPGIIYGGEENVNISLDERDLNKLIYTAEVFNVILSVDGKEYSTIIRDLQFHPVTDKPLHVDFLVVSEDKPFTVKLPVVLTGNSIGVMNGGKLRSPLRKLEVSGTLSAMPDAGVEIDVTNLRIGQSVKVGSIAIDGLEFLDSPSNVIVAVKMARGAVLDEEEEGEEGEESEEASEE